MDISDILTSVSTEPARSAQSRDLQALTRAWVNERVAPEVLPWPEELMVRVMRGVSKLVSFENFFVIGTGRTERVRCSNRDAVCFESWEYSFNAVSFEFR